MITARAWNKKGRAALGDPEVRKKILERVALGQDPVKAAMACGVAHHSIRDWMERGAKLADAEEDPASDFEGEILSFYLGCLTAVGDLELDMLRTMVKAAGGKGTKEQILAAKEFLKKSGWLVDRREEQAPPQVAIRWEVDPAAAQKIREAELYWQQHPIPELPSDSPPEPLPEQRPAQPQGNPFRPGPNRA